MTKNIRMTLFTLLLVYFSSLMSVNLKVCEAATALPSGSIGLEPELAESLKNLRTNEIVLLWVDIKALMDGFGNAYLPEDPALYGIRWIMITFDPNIEQTHLFWVLAEVEAGKVQEISRISWVKRMILVRTGKYVRLSMNTKFAMEGIDYAIKRAVNEGNKSLQVILYLENQTHKTLEKAQSPSNNKDFVLANLTSFVSQLDGKILKTGSYKNKLLARIPSQLIEKIAENLYVSEIYLQGPVVFEGEFLVEKQNVKRVSYHFTNDLATKLSYLIILGSILDFATSIKKTRRRRLTLYVIAILSTSFILVLVPSVQALNVSTEAIRATDVWNLGVTGTGVNVAVIDDGIDFNHPDFPKEAIRTSWNFPDNNATLAQDRNGHGTHVAGIIAGRGIMNPVYKGVAWSSRLVVVRITTAFDLDDAIYWVRDNKDTYNIKVLSLSWAAPGSPTGEDGMSVYSKAVDDAIETGIVVIKSAGNGGPGPKTITTPGDAFNVITVGAADDNNTVNIADDILRERSSRGPTGDEGGGRPKPDVVAPGVRIMSTNLTGGYVERNGTSHSAPHVAGTVALMLEANPNLTPAQVKAILRQTARKNTHLSGLDVNDRGHGIIDALAAVQLAQNVANIDRNQMYDSWTVKTPDRYFDPIGKSGDYLTFTVDAPSSTFGIGVSDMWYHNWDNWGSTRKDYKLLSQISAQHVWIDGIYYDLGTDMNKYLLSGLRIFGKGSGYVGMRALYMVNNVMVDLKWSMHVDEIRFWLTYWSGESWKTLMYVDPNVWDATNFPYLPTTSETIYYETKVTGSDPLYVRDLGHVEYVKIEPWLWEEDFSRWVLRHGYLGNNPDTAINDEYTYDRDVAIYCQSTSCIQGVYIYRKFDSLPAPPQPPSTPSTPSGSNWGYKHTTYTYETSSTDPLFDIVHYEFDWGDGTRNWTDWYVIDGSHIASADHSWSTGGIYNVRVRTQDCRDAWSDWSQSLAVNIHCSLTVTTRTTTGYQISNVKVWVDGNLYYSPVTVTVSAGAHTVEAESDFMRGTFWYTFDHWQDRSTQNPRSVNVPTDITVTAYYEKQMCPTLFVWNGTEYVYETLLDIHAESDVTVQHQIQQPLALDGFFYKLQLRELDNYTSHIDQVKLYAVDNSGEWRLCPLASAKLNQTYVTIKLLFDDDWRVDLAPSEIINLKFLPTIPYNQTMYFIFEINGYNKKEP